MSNKPIRTSISGPDAIPLLNRGKSWLRLVDAMPDAFGPGNPLNEVIRNSLGNRTLIGLDGSVLRTQRGPINFVEARMATAPSPAVLAQRGLAAGEFLALEVDDTLDGAGAGLLLLPWAGVAAGSPVLVFGVVPVEVFYASTPGLYRGRYGAEVADLPPVGRLREVVGSFTPATEVHVQQDTEGGYSGEGLHTVSSNRTTSVVQNALGDDLTAIAEMSTVYEWTAQEALYLARPTAATKYYGSAAWPFTRHADAFGFTIKDVYDEPAPPWIPDGSVEYPLYPYFGSGSRVGASYYANIGRRQGWIDASNHFFAMFYEEETRSDEYALSPETLTEEFFRLVGEEQSVVGPTFTDPSLVAVRTGLNETSSLTQLPVTASSRALRNVLSLQFNGAAIQIADYDPSQKVVSVSSLNYYRGDDVRRPSGLFVVSTRNEALGVNEELRVGVVRDGAVQARAFQYDGDWVIVGERRVRLTGRARRVVLLPEDNNERLEA